MSGGADRAPEPLPAEWLQLEGAAQEAALSLSRWKVRAREAEEEVERLRRSLEALAGDEVHTGTSGSELRRLKAENAAFRSRLAQGRNRLAELMRRLSALGIEE